MFPSVCPSPHLGEGSTVRKSKIKIMWKLFPQSNCDLALLLPFFLLFAVRLKWYFSLKYLKGLQSVCLLLYFTLVCTSIIHLSKMWQENKFKFFRCRLCILFSHCCFSERNPIRSSYNGSEVRLNNPPLFLLLEDEAKKKKKVSK